VIGEAPAVVAAYFDSLNAEDFDRLRRLWTDDATLRAVGQQPRHGRDAVMEYFCPLFRTWARHVDTPTRITASGDVVVVEISFAGTTLAGKELRFDAVDVFDLSGESIAALSTWYDLHWLVKQL
jgi:ketosteroid isomerase-like protein